jgi:hypothetical protein
VRQFTRKDRQDEKDTQEKRIKVSACPTGNEEKMGRGTRLNRQRSIQMKQIIPNCISRKFIVIWEPALKKMIRMRSKKEGLTHDTSLADQHVSTVLVPHVTFHTK